MIITATLIAVAAMASLMIKRENERSLLNAIRLAINEAVFNPFVFTKL
jgi:hypothetical protein